MVDQGEQTGDRLGCKQYRKAQQNREQEAKQHGVPVYQRRLMDATGPPTARDQRGGSDGHTHQYGLYEEEYPVSRCYRGHFAGAQPGDYFDMQEPHRVEQQVRDNRGPGQSPDTVAGDRRLDGRGCGQVKGLRAS